MLYYLLSNNFINKIINAINTDFILNDDDFLSFYVNFLKSISLKLDLTTLHFFFLTQTNNFPLLEISLSLYNHQDKMIQSVVKNILLIILKINYPPLVEYLCSLPSLSYFSSICIRLKDLLLLLSKENNYEQFKSLQEDIVDETMFIQDIFLLKIEKINHILTNSLFSYCILPYIINKKYDKIKLNIKLYFLNVLFNFIQDESFLNLLFTTLFFPYLLLDINDFIINPIKEPDNYFYLWEESNNRIKLSSQSFYNYIKYNFNEKSLKYIISEKDSKFPEFSLLSEKFKEKLINQNEKVDKEMIFEILNYFSSEGKNKLFNYNENLSLGTGINYGINQYQSKEDRIYDKCFKNILEKFYIIYFDKSLGFKTKLIDNNIKSFIFSLINIKQKNDNILFLICILIGNLIIKNNEKISKLLLKEIKIVNGNNLTEEEINNVIKINNNSNNLLINEEFQEMEECESDDENFNKIIETEKMKKILTLEDNEKIKKNNLIKEDKFTAFDNNYFDKIEKYICGKNKNNINDYNSYYYNNDLIELFLDLLDIKNNLKPIIFKCITDNIISLITKKKEKENQRIVFCSPLIKSKIENIYKEFKNYIIKNYKRNQNFHLYAYNKFKYQYKIFLSLNNFDYENIIKEGYIILNQNLLNFNSENISDNIKGIIFDKKYKDEEDEEKEILDNNIIKFFIIHDFYYIISNENNDPNIGKDLFINNYPLKFDELVINKQYFLYDLNSNIKYYPSKCKINLNQNNSSDFFDSSLLLYENNIYIGNSSSNPNYTRIIHKYSLSNCSAEKNNNIQRCINLYIIDNENNNYVEIQLIFPDSKIDEKIIGILNEEIKLSRIIEKMKFKEFLHKLK